jgi:Sulfotransferase family
MNQSGIKLIAASNNHPVSLDSGSGELQCRHRWSDFGVTTPAVPVHPGHFGQRTTGGQMKDRYWQAVYDMLRPLLDDADVVLAPRGGWPAFSCPSVLYDDLIEIGDCTVLVLHKAKIVSMPKAELLTIADQWQWIFANEVFIVLSRSEKIRSDIRRSANIVHCRPLIRFLCSASLRKRRSRIIYVHVPKTGGTSMWASLTRAFPSHVYYPSIHAFLRNPPASGDYDLIGLHFSPTVLSRHLSENDRVIGMVRHPTDRFLSGVMHCRRETEDPETFTQSTRAMRDMQLADYLATDLGRFEARLQLITFGTDYRHSPAAPSDREMLYSALAFAQRENVVLAPSERSDAFGKFLAKRLSFRPGPLGRLNANRPDLRAAYWSEFRDSIEVLNSINAREREFYEFVCRLFRERQLNSYPRRRCSRARRGAQQLTGWPSDPAASISG